MVAGPVDPGAEPRELMRRERVRIRGIASLGGGRMNLDTRNLESRFRTGDWHFANAKFMEISHVGEINPKIFKLW